MKKQIDFLQVQLAELQGKLNTANNELARRSPAETAPVPSTVTPVPAPGLRSPAYPDPRSTSPSSAGSSGRPAPSPTFPAAPVARTVVVRQGDTFGTIARRHGISVPALMRANPVVEPKRIKPGQVLNLPPAN